MQYDTKPLDYLTMVEVAAILKLKDSESAQKWCFANDVPIHKVAKRNLVYAIDVELVKSLPFVIRLKAKYPENWRRLLQDVLRNEPLYSLIIQSLGASTEKLNFTRIKPSTKEEQKLLKQLLS